MPPTHGQFATRRGLDILPRKRLTATAQRCAFCGEDVLAGERIVRLGGSPAHVACALPAPAPVRASAA